MTGELELRRVSVKGEGQSEPAGRMGVSPAPAAPFLPFKCHTGNGSSRASKNRRTRARLRAAASPSEPDAMTDKTISLPGIALSVLISAMIVAGTLGGFWFGRHKLGSVISVETRTTSLYDVVGREIEDPSAARALAQLYGVAPDDHEALTKRLRGVAWVPPSRPAPFVGHVARPLPGGEPPINGLGFRDARDVDASKPSRTVRVFLTGGSTAWGSGAPSQQTTIP